MAGLPEGLRCSGCERRVECREGVWGFAAHQPPGFSPERRAHLEGLAAGHFWFPPRRRLLAALLDLLPRRLGAGLDLGCGTGGFLPVLAERCAEVVGVDAYEESLRIAARRCPAAVLVQADICDVPLGDDQFDLIVALDVLEHVPPEVFLGQAARLVTRGGHLLLSVPAAPALWSDYDELAGHRCRYTRRQAQSELAAAGWELIHWTHYQLLLLPLVWLSRRLTLLRRRRVERRPPAFAGRLLSAVNSMEVRLFQRRRLPIGSSLVALARRGS